MIRTAIRLLLLLLALSILPAVCADSLYKWVDDQGNVHYSDKPQPGATKLHLPKPTTYAAPNVAMPAPAAGSETDQAPTAEAYTSFAIGSPSDEQTFWNVQSITVTLAVQPALHPGDTVTITLDDKTQGPGNSVSATFDGLVRGAHVVHATLQQAGGGAIIAKPVTFYIQQNTQKGMH